MKFLDDNILLESDLAVDIYNKYASELPIIDYHCHIDQRLILSNKKFANITELWLAGDHYKWRLMRNSGVDEKYITGDASDKDKFRMFCRILPLAIGNPIYIWCHLELKKYFGITLPISEKTADQIFDLTAKLLSQDDFSAVEIIKKSNVELICTTDDPIDDLGTHQKLKSMHSFQVLPTLRPDKALNIELVGFGAYIDQLSEVSSVKISCIDSLISALKNRVDFFASNGCVISDHALSQFTYEDCSHSQADAILKKALSNTSISPTEAEQYRTYVLLKLSALYAERNIVMQLHFNCARNNNTQMFGKLGADTGFDAINSSQNPTKLIKFLDALQQSDSLPKTIIYSLDPNDNKLINTIINCFQGGVRGKIQHGAAWWFNDTEVGMKDHLITLGEYSVLGNFVGMLTDSRSFTSYIRHDYFRRILCNYVADQVLKGKYPLDDQAISQLVQGICYNNIKDYLKK